MGATACSKPFVISELVIASKELVEKRARKYSPAEHEYPIKDLPKFCDFSVLNNKNATSEHGENGLYCNR